MTTIRVTLAWASIDSQSEIALELDSPATIQMAIDAIRHLTPAITGCIDGAVAFGVWGKVRPLDFLLRNADRVEIYRALQADPKDARRTNARRQSANSKAG
jgi:putative ubiquitin-RnfH superfamily antitoxin RatB of RatAB toxin-antitoxin module